MKIGITCYPTYGGSGVVATELGLELAKRGYEIHFICYDRPYRLPDYVSNVFYHEVQVSQYPLFEYPPYSLALASKMVEIVKRNNLDILHVHYAIPHATSAILAKQMLNDEIKVVTTLHGTDITVVGADPSFLEITKFAMEKSDAVTAVSHYLKGETTKTFKTDKAIQVIYNFFDPVKDETGTCKREYFAKKDEKIITHISNFRKLKRIDDVVLTVAKVLKEKRVKLLMVGDGPERATAERMCQELNICDHVSFLGKQQDIGSILSKSDFFLFPSASESFGLAALEAMSYALPVIASNAGGIREVVEDGVSGILANVGDTDKMAEALVMLLNDEEAYHRFSESALKRSKVFDTAEIIPQYIDLYHSLKK